ncbi:MAG: insulinase family protein [Candidatus Sericytochromatia bacterium]|nr:insulinase family protein [Candidatus Sericytochromatia bacterium]
MVQRIVAPTGAQEHVLANGLRVLTKEVRTTPVVSMMTWYRVGSGYERSGETGVSHFLEHMMFKGTDRYGKGEIDLITQRNGGSNNAFTAYDYTSYHFAFASDRWLDGLAIEASRMRRCAFDPVEFEAEKQVVLEEWRMSQDSPWHPLIDQLSATGLTVHPYRHPILGWYQDVQDLTREQMVAYYDRFYGPNNATLVLVGDFDTAEALRQVETHFGDVPAISPTPPAPVREIPPDGERRFVMRRPTAVPRLAIGYRQPPFGHPDVPAVEVLTTLLSHGRTSRFYQSLVEDQQIVADIGMEFFLTADPFLLTVFAELKPGGSVTKVEKAILAEIRKLQREPVSAAELSKAKNLLAAGEAFDDETSMAQAHRYGEAAALGDWREADALPVKIQAVTAEDVRRVAKRYLDAATRTVGVQKAGKRPPFLDEDESEPIEAPPPRPLNPPKLILAAPRLVLPQVHRWVLPNGMVLLVQANPASPTVSTKVHLPAGSRCEAPAKAGLASLLAHVIVKGAGMRDGEAFAQAIEAVGGGLDCGAGVSGTSLQTRFLKAHAPLGLSLLADVMLQPHLTEHEIAKERALQLDDLAASEDDPKSVARRAFHALIYGDHPSSRPTDGSLETVKGLEQADLQAFHQRCFRPDRAVMVVVGDVDPTAIHEQVLDLFGNWTATGPFDVHVPVPPNAAASQRIVVQDRAQAHIYLGQMGVRRTNPDYATLDVLEAILGGGSGLSSRIPSRIRDEKGLAYTAYCDLVGSAGMEPGSFHAYLATDPTNTAAAVAALYEEFDRIAAEPVTLPELQDAQAYLTGSFVFQLESDAQKADYLLRSELFGLGFDYAETYAQSVLAVTREDLLQVTQQHLQTDAMSLAIVGPVAPKLTFR